MRKSKMANEDANVRKGRFEMKPYSYVPDLKIFWMESMITIHTLAAQSKF